MADVERNFDYMGWIKGQPCALSPHGLSLTGLVDRPGRPAWSAVLTAAGPCSGLVEADHAGLDRGLSQKADDDTCVPLCQHHHQDRTETNGYFATLTLDQRRMWRIAMITHHRMRYSRLRQASDAGWF